jgi:NADH-ubiquinone oxidoreductase chain 4
LPKAHVEAPAVGSIILAAILLKLRAYGLYRVVFLADSFLRAYKEVFLVLLLYGAFISALICLIQSDIKALIAYSSISHIGVLLAGFLVQDFIAIQGV